MRLSGSRRLRYLLFCLFWALVSCVTVDQELDPKVYYTRDLLMRTSDGVYKGVGVIPFKNSYKFIVKSPGKMDLLVIETCHREVTIEKAGFREWFQFNRNIQEESRPDCAFIRFASFEHKRGRHGDGLLVAAHPDYELMAILNCNGKLSKYVGTSVCQAREGLYQSISFTENVRLFQSKCKLDLPERASTFRFRMPKRSCRFAFLGDSGKRHILYSEGYEQILIRE